jgi:hypothetical protein
MSLLCKMGIHKYKEYGGFYGFRLFICQRCGKEKKKEDIPVPRAPDTIEYVRRLEWNDTLYKLTKERWQEENSDGNVSVNDQY